MRLSRALAIAATLSVLSACSVPVDSTFTTTAFLPIQTSGYHYANKIKFDLVNDIQSTLEDLDISPDKIDLNKLLKLKLRSDSSIPADQQVHFKIFILPIYEEHDIDDPNIKVLLAGTPFDGTDTFGELLSGKSYTMESAGFTTLRNVLTDEDLKQLSLLFQLDAWGASQLPQSITMDLTFRAFFEKSLPK